MPPPQQHLVMELRYDHTLHFYTVMDKIGIDLSAAYPDWERSPLTLEIRNKKSRRRCFLSSSRSFFEAIDFEVEGPEYDRGAKFLEKVHHEVKFTKVRRFGLRRWLAVKSDDPLPKLVKIAAQKLHPQDDGFNGLLRGSIQDVGYTFDVLTDIGWKYQLRFGPMEKKQWFEIIPHEAGAFESAEDMKKYRESFPERFFFIDMDCSKLDITYADLPDLLGSVRQVSEQVISDLIRYLKA